MSDDLFEYAERRAEEEAKAALRHVPERVQRFRAFFKDNYLEWLDRNWHIYQQFEDHALRLIARGRTHYSARTIVEVLVHDTILREADAGEFKIGNDKAPDLARTFAVLHPGHALFWEYRRADWPDFLEALGVEK